MKKTILSAAVVVVAGLICFSANSRAQSNGTSASAPTKIGLIDMAEVFKKYKKFDALREGLKADIKATDDKAKGMAAQAKALQEQLKSGTFAPDSAQYKKIESQLIQLQAEFTGFKQQSQREFMRKESQIYKTVYLEVASSVEKYAKYYKYTMILRFNRKNLEEADDPQGVLQSMNKQVIYSQPEDDITDSVVDYLNRVYAGRSADGRNSK